MGSAESGDKAAGIVGLREETAQTAVDIDITFSDSPHAESVVNFWHYTSALLDRVHGEGADIDHEVLAPVVAGMQSVRQAIHAGRFDDVVRFSKSVYDSMTMSMLSELPGAHNINDIPNPGVPPRDPKRNRDALERDR